MTHNEIKVRETVLGEHFHLRVFMGDDGGYALTGTLVMRRGERWVFLEALNKGCVLSGISFSVSIGADKP